MKKLLITLLLGIWLPCHVMADVVLTNQSALRVSINKKEAKVVHTALEMFRSDYRRVFGQDVVKARKAELFIGTIGLGSTAEKALGKAAVNELKAHPEAFLLLVKDKKLYVLGSDKRGTAYGILELSRLIGVSPWEWWADSSVEAKEQLTLPDGFRRMEHPSVAHRGIFLNDEDWGLMPWSYLTNEPSDRQGRIGPRTHERIFQLLLRLRGNTFWPAMHSCTVAFYLTPGNKEMADRYGIYIGTSHCEPMMRNTNAEWNAEQRGEYDYVHNRDSVLKFWEERVTALAGSDNIYTLGIRGVHDGKMQGAKTVAEQKAALTDILKEQRKMIARYVNPDVEKVSQVFIPYKEVLDVYNAGLQVPKDVSLMWCDDNYGYIRHFPTAKERARKGGNSIYYHVSYWGRPHDYLWLATNHPAQLYTQMKMAYDKGARDQWILNVGDIKPAEYLIELFMDMAWDINAIENNEKGLNKHQHDWLAREFGDKYADELLPVMNEYYRLAYIRKPEFMGGTRTEENDPAYKIVRDLPWSKEEIETRIKDYSLIEDKVIALSEKLPAEKALAWFQLVEYPVRGAAEMNKKHLYAQLARHSGDEETREQGDKDIPRGLVNSSTRPLTYWQLSDDAYHSIVSLTEKYNTMNNGKWANIMSYHPRDLAVFDSVPRQTIDTPLLKKETPLCLLNGKDYASFKGEQPTCYGMGYQRGAIHLQKGSSVTYQVRTELPDSVEIEVALAPNHPVEGNQIRYAICVNDGQPQEVDYHTVGRSEEWKQNVLTNQAIRRTLHATQNSKTQKLTITLTALDEGMVIDQISINE